MKTSFFGKLSPQDWLKGLIMTIGTPIVSGLLLLVANLINNLQGGQAFNLPSVKIQVIIVILTGISAGLTYVLKNWGTNSQDAFLKSEPKDD